MGEIIHWLIHDDQKGLYNFLFALALNILFLILAALLLWLLGDPTLAGRLAKGYGALWIVIVVVTILLGYTHRLFRVNLYDHANVYVISCLVVSGVVQAGWSAFAALAAHDSAMAAVSYLVAFLSCYIAFVVITSFYQGVIYGIFNLPLALASFIVFSLWPASADLLYGWFFQL
jgi:hypothetical protein